MPSALPDGDPAPEDGRLPEPARAGLGQRPLGIYVHVPFCRVRCGYCDFNTYTAEELGGGASRASYAAQAVAEIRQARAVLGDGAPPVSTVFFGGGTPTLLPPRDLVAVVDAVRDAFGLVPDAEVTTESNPDSVDARRPRGPGGGRHQPGLVRHAVGGAARCWPCSTAPTTRSACRASSTGRGPPGSGRSAST